jgi:hypothetical protein
MAIRGNVSGGSSRLTAALAAVLTVTLVTAAPAPTGADTKAPVVGRTQKIDFDRPESWAMKYFASVTLLTPAGAPRADEPWSLSLSVEVASIPHLSTEERRVGFDGRKVEDLNKLPVMMRPRVAVSLPWRLALELAYVPPIEVGGVRTDLISGALSRPLWSGARWSVHGRLHGQIGNVEGDFTCSAEDAAGEPGTPANPFGCQAPSSDEASLEYWGGALTVSYRPRPGSGASYFAGMSVQEMDLEFQVDALTFGVRDRNLLLTRGSTWSVFAGAGWRVGGRWSLGAEAHYAPLDVRRSGSAEAPQNDPLFHLRTTISYDW